MSEHDRSKVTTPEQHLAEQFRQLKILRAKVKQAEAELLCQPEGNDTEPKRDQFANRTRSRTTTIKRD
jgi:hypothetical protein